MSVQASHNVQGDVFDNGYQVLKDKGLALIWVSVGNSYFNKETLEDLLLFTEQHFSQTKIVVPYEPAVYTYLGHGYDEKKADTKARLGSNRLKNHIQRIITEEHLQNNRLLDWSEDIAPTKEFQNSFKYITSLYNTSNTFQQDCKKTTSNMLEYRKGSQPTDDNVSIAVKYLLQELSYVLATPKLFSIKKTVYLYHKRWPILENLVNGKYTENTNKEVGFLIVKSQ